MPPASSARRTPWALVALAVVSVVALCALLAWGLEYYALPLHARRDAALHRALKPSGAVGHGYGIAGTALILSNLLYLVRRRFAAVEALGAMRAWLRWHVFSGLAGPALVVLHSAFTLRTWPAMVSAGALAVVVVTGLAGRYLYGLVPRARDGHRRSLEDARGELDRAFMALRALGPAGVRAVDALETALDAALPRAAPAGGVLAIPAALAARWRTRALPRVAARAATAAGASPADAARVRAMTRDLGLRALRADALELLDAAASSWRAAHRVLAVAMVLAAGLHVTIALYLGYGL